MASRDPCWIKARYDGKDAKGNTVRKGERVLYFPVGRAIYKDGVEAQKMWAEFQGQVADELFMAGGR